MKINERIKSIYDFIITMFTPFRKTKGVYDIISSLLNVLINVGIIVPLLIALIVISPNALLFVIYTLAGILLLAIFAGIRLQLWKDTKPDRIATARKSLALLREKGVQLWHKGSKLKNNGEVQGWIDDVKNWQYEVITKIEVIDEAEVELFKTIHIAQAMELETPLSPAHNMYWGILHYQLESIKDFVRRTAYNNSENS